MIKSNLYYFSLALNILFILGLIVVSIVYRERIYKKMFPHTAENTSFVLLGNSITARGNWESLLQRNDFVNSGMSGYTTSQYLPHFGPAVLDYQPKVCFIEGGINDFSFGIPVQRTYDNFIAMITQLQENNIIPIIQSTSYSVDNPKVNAMVDELNLKLKEYALLHHLDYIDLNALTALNGKLNPDYATDSVHLNEKAYVLWAEEVKIILNKYGLK